MRERAEPVLKIACLILAAFLFYELVGILLRFNPLHGVSVPALPVLAVSTNNPPAGVRGGTNLAVSTSAEVKGTNHQASTGTNVEPSVKIVVAGTNSTSPPATATVTNGTNLVVMAAAAGGTNVSNQPKPEVGSANASMPPEMARMNASPSLSSGRRGDDLPPVIQARISRIIDSEIFGAVPHPQPMALLGIAGDCAFLRSPSGQTGLVKEGDTLGELKLLKIGINRVLVEQDGQKKELMIFSGYGGESLLPKQKETPDENKNP